jgi:hypothetical protein
MGVRQGVSSDSDEQVGSTSKSTVTQTNLDKDEMEKNGWSYKVWDSQEF